MLMKFYITGANGFIGSNLIDKLVEQGHEVRALVLKGTDESNLNQSRGKIEIIYGDVTNHKSIHSHLDGIDVVIHLAARVDDLGPKELFYNLNYQGSKNVLDAAIGAGVKRFVFMSSLTVHGFKDFRDSNEYTEYNPYNTYAETKREVEDLLNESSQANKIETVVVRPGFIIFGPRDILFSRETYERVCKDGKFVCVNKGKSLNCYSYVENLVDGLILVSTHPKAAGETYVISDGPIITYREFMRNMFESCNTDLKLTSAPYWLAMSGATLLEGIYKLFKRKKGPIITRYRVHVASCNLGFVNDKIINDLGYEAKIDLQEACKRTFEWFQKVK